MYVLDVMVELNAQIISRDFLGWVNITDNLNATISLTTTKQIL